MIDGTYKVKLETPLGVKPAAITIRTQGNRVLGEIDAPIVGKQRVEGTLGPSDTFTARGTIRLMFAGKVDYALYGKVVGDHLSVSIESNKGNVELVGTRI